MVCAPLASIPFKLSGNVLWILNSLSCYTLHTVEATLSQAASPLFDLPQSSPALLRAQENLSFIVKVMLSHLSQSLMLSFFCFYPSPSTLLLFFIACSPSHDCAHFPARVPFVAIKNMLRSAIAFSYSVFPYAIYVDRCNTFF